MGSLNADCASNQPFGLLMNSQTTGRACVKWDDLHINSSIPFTVSVIRDGITQEVPRSTTKWVPVAQ